jgi:hypothetical protein
MRIPGIERAEMRARCLIAAVRVCLSERKSTDDHSRDLWRGEPIFSAVTPGRARVPDPIGRNIAGGPEFSGE